MNNETQTRHVGWLEGNKWWVYPLAAAILGLFGGSADKLASIAPSLAPASTSRVDALETRLNELQTCSCDLNAVKSCECQEKVTRDYNRPTE